MLFEALTHGLQGMHVSHLSATHMILYFKNEAAALSIVLELTHGKTSLNKATQKEYKNNVHCPDFLFMMLNASMSPLVIPEHSNKLVKTTVQRLVNYSFSIFFIPSKKY